MTILVVDASALAALLFGEPEGAAIMERTHGHALHAPTLLRYELANIYLKKVRRSPAMRDKLLQALLISEKIDILLHDVEAAGAIALAERFVLSSYDASYLWLARELNAELVTLDMRLAIAAQ